MTDNECIARYVMGWHKDTATLPHMYHWEQEWKNERNSPMVLEADWRPDADLSQAMQVVEAMRVQKWNVILVLPADGGCGCNCNKFKPVQLTEPIGIWDIWGRADRLELAIHAAAVQVARVMEAALDTQA